jgi:two-component system LytT family response regulator
MNILIIDNEPSLRNTLKELIKLSGFTFTNIAEASGVKEGITQIHTQHPDIVFLDIEMGDGTGFDLMRQIPNPQFQLIFVTAHNEYAIDAFKFSAIDYLLKPIDPESLVNSLERATANIKTKLLSEQLDVVLQQLSGKADKDKRIVLRDIDNIYFVKVKDIMYCMADGTYTRFFLDNKKEILVSKNLKEYENLLEPIGFLRTHHSYLVNPDKITMYDKSAGGALILEGGAYVPVSQRKKELIITILEKKNT